MLLQGVLDAHVRFQVSGFGFRVVGVVGVWVVGVGRCYVLIDGYYYRNGCLGLSRDDFKQGWVSPSKRTL